MRECRPPPARRQRLGTLAIIASGCIAAAGLRLFTCDPDGPAPAKITPVPAADNASTRAPHSTKARERHERELVKTNAGTSCEPKAVQADRMRVQGTIVVVDANGDTHQKEDGELHIRLTNPTAMNAGIAEEADVLVRNGAFSFTASPHNKIEIDSATLGGRPTRLSESSIQVRNMIELRATWSAPTTLRVVDGEHGLDLTEITVVAVSNWLSSNRSHPGIYTPQDVRIAGGRSPLQLIGPEPRLMRSEEVLWIHSPGYAWAQLTVNHKNATERKVELHRGGTLRVRLEGRLSMERAAPGEEAPTEPRIRLRKHPVQSGHEAGTLAAIDSLAKAHDAKHWQPRPTSAELRTMIEQGAARTHLREVFVDAKAQLREPIVLKGIAPGCYAITVEIGSDRDSPLILGETTVTVVAGAIQRAIVDVSPPTAPTPVPLSGTFFLPSAWAEPLASLSFAPLDLPGKTSRDTRHISLQQMKPDHAARGLYRWDAGLVAPSRYEVNCYALNLRWVIDTGPSGNSRAEFRASAPIHVSVRVREEATGRWIEDANVLWGTNARGGSRSRATWDPTKRNYGFRAVSGIVRIGVFSTKYSMVGKCVFDVQPGSRDFVLGVRRNCGTVLRLKHNETPIPWDDSQSDPIISTPEGAIANHISGKSPSHGMRITVDKPGSYQVTVPDQPGFDPIPPIHITISAGEFIEHWIQLRRHR